MEKRKILNDDSFKWAVANQCGKFCDFEADDGQKTKRVFFADTMGLDWPEHKGCHVNLSLYYETHKAMTIMFATHADAWAYVDSKGKKDNRIIKKTALTGGGWSLKLKNERGLI